MSVPQATYARYRVVPGQRVHLAEVDPAESEDYRCKDDVRELLRVQRERIADLQERLFAEGRRGVLVVLQAMDAGGKDGTISGVFRGVNPQGCRVWSFKAPTPNEQAHDFLWRHHVKGPERGIITIFNRSHYEDVLVPRVKGLVEEAVWRQRHDVIRAFEHGLSVEDMVIVKFFLHISREEQRRRLQRRLENPAKHWKFNVQDLEERKRWDDYQVAYEDALGATSTDEAPWYIVPADRKWYRNLVIARTVADTLAAMDPRCPDAEQDLAGVTVDE